MERSRARHARTESQSIVAGRATYRTKSGDLMKQTKKAKKSKAKIKTVKIKTGIRAGIWACCNY
jgi:hypothetical protein